MKVSASPDLMASMSIGWYFGSTAMAAFGAIAISAGLGAVRTGGRVFHASLIVGLAYGGFGLATYAIYHEAHFLGFVAIGLLAVIGSVRAHWPASIGQPGEVLMPPRRIKCDRGSCAGGRRGCACPGCATRRLLPVDEAARQPDFFTFRAQLLTAVARHDAAALMAVVHPNIKCDFGGGEGKAFFEEFWKPGAPGSEVWAELAAVLALGGTLDTPDSFVAPYVHSRWPQGVDAFEHVAVVGDRVRIRTAPRQDAEPTAVSSFEILPLARPSGDTPEGWTAVSA